MRRATTAALMLASLALVACGSSGSSSSTSGSGDASSSGASGGAEKPTVRVAHPGKVNFGTWDPAQNKAYKGAAEQGNWDLQVAEAVPYGEAEALFDRWGREQVKVVFSIDAGYEAALLRSAATYPKTAWVMMSGLSSTKGLENVASYSLNWCQIGYAQGVIAALASKKGVIGNVGAVKILPAELILEGEKAGIAATGKSPQVKTQYSGDFLAADKSAEIASALIHQGADVIIGITNGGVASQLAARIETEGAKYIGTYSDEKTFAPKATLTSVVADFSKDYSAIVDSQMQGSFKSQQVDRGFGDNVLKLTPFANGAESIEAKAKALIDDMVSGKAKFPAGSKCA
jgi:basic membrane protein A